jgi:hypothetical protein
MADDVSVNTNTGATGATNVTVAADVIGSVAYQRVKIAIGADGAAVDASTANPVPVVQTGTPALPTGAATETTLAAVAASVDTVETLLGTSNTNTGATTTALGITNTQLGGVTETAPATDTASSGLNGRLQRIAQRLTSLIALVPASLGAKAAASSFAVTSSTEDAALQGALTETAPATDTASSGLNGRLQRIAQRLTSLIALVPTSLGSKAAASSFAVTQSTEDAAQLGSLTETAPASDTASSGLNGRLQRIAQRLTSLIALVPTSLATGGGLRATIQDTAGVALDYTVPALVGGDIAHDSPVSTSKPIMVAGRATTANPTAVADADVSRIMVDKLGKVIAVGAVRDLKAMQSTTITASTSETTIVTAIASTFCDLYGLILSNSSATATSVTIKDSTTGTTRAVIYVPAGDTRGFMLGAGDALPQATVNTNWTATSSASITSLFVSAYYVKNI